MRESGADGADLIDETGGDAGDERHSNPIPARPVSRRVSEPITNGVESELPLAGFAPPVTPERRDGPPPPQEAPPPLRLAPWVPAPSAPALASEAPSPHAQSAFLPTVPRTADLAVGSLKWYWPVLCFLITFAIYVALVPRFLLYSSPPTGDQPFYLMDTASLVEDQDLNVANNYAQRDEDKFYSLAPHPPGFIGMSAPYPLPGQFANSTARPTTEKYAFHLPGLGIAMVPAWAIGGIFSLWWPATVVFMCIVGALVSVNVFLLAYEITGRRWVAWAVWLPVAFSNPIWTYSYLIFTELPVGLLLVYAFRRMALGWGSNSRWRLLLVGLCIAYLPWLAWRTVILAVPLGLYALGQWWRYFRVTRSARTDSETTPLDDLPGGRSSGTVWSALWIGVPILLSAGILLWYNHFLFNSFVPPTKVPELGDSSPFLWPWQGSDQFTHFVTDAFALLFDRQMGLLTYAPIYLLAAVGMIAMWRSSRAADRRLLGAMGVIALPYAGMLASFVYWHGIWCPPARYLTSLAPLLAAPLGLSLYALARSSIYKVVYVVLSIPGVILAAVMVWDARLMWPANPVLGWLAGKMPFPLQGLPNTPVHIDLLSLLPGFNPIDEAHLPSASAWVTGISLALVFGCYLLLMQQGRIPRRLPTAVHGIVWLVVLATIGSGWLVMNHEYIKHKTDLVQLARWSLAPAPSQPRGMAYLDGKLFVTDWAGKSLTALDTTNGAYRAVQARTAQGPLSYAQPGDVKVGPDGLLYFLNNGPGAQALFVMQSDGQVVRQETLEGKSATAVGLAFGQDGKMYVADMVGGHIYKYDLKGGRPLASIGGQSGGFNNIWGIVVDRDGTIYAAENSGNRIEVIDSKGEYVRSFSLKCSPTYMAIDGDWLDTLCSDQFLSVNKITGDTQSVQIEGEVPPIKSPSSLAYDLNGTLYILQGGDLVAYRIEH